MKYTVIINDFEGPLDLLLHLIKESKIDIYDISIEEITKQYLSYITQMEELNLSVASEYLVMATDLIEMKSRLLIPNQQINEQEEYEEDPREKLINKLLEYKKYKEITNDFKKLEEMRSQIYTKMPSNLKEYMPSNTKVIYNNDVNLSDLLSAFERVLNRCRLNKPLHTKITKKEITVDERSNEIRDILKIKKEIEFIALFDVMSKDYIVVTFLSILEMAKKQEIEIKQDKYFGDIILILI